MEWNWDPNRNSLKDYKRWQSNEKYNYFSLEKLKFCSKNKNISYEQTWEILVSFEKFSYWRLHHLVFPLSISIRINISLIFEIIFQLFETYAQFRVWEMTSIVYKLYSIEYFKEVSKMFFDVFSKNKNYYSVYFYW